jgi:NtrC-family two-component system response regulator AlgB
VDQQGQHGQLHLAGLDLLAQVLGGRPTISSARNTAVTSLRRTLRLTLESMKHQVTDVAAGQPALAALAQERFDLAFLDLRLGRDSGLDLLPQFLTAAPGVGVVVMTAFAAIDTAVEAMRRGAFEYLPKPFTPEQLRMLLVR